MDSKLENLLDLIFEKLTKYKYKKINLEKEEFRKFIFSLINNS